MGRVPGKTVVALHRAQHLAESSPEDRSVLATTFTTTLAGSLEGNHQARFGLSHTGTFLSQEWRHVVLAQGVATREESAVANLTAPGTADRRFPRTPRFRRGCAASSSWS